MTDQEAELLAHALWSRRQGFGEERVYAVLDAARDAEVFRFAQRLGGQCLYAEVPFELQAAAPHLCLIPGEAVLAELVERGWGRSWGVLAIAAGELEPLRRHLKKFLRVEDEDGRRLLFRYYDPRVLRAYLPTCTRAERAELFGPIAEFLLEPEEGDGFLAFTVEERQPALEALPRDVLDVTRRSHP